MEKQKELELKIGGMHCAACAVGIEKGLSKMPGVNRASVNYAMGTASVDFEPGKIDELSITNKISELGYSARNALGADLFDNQESKKARRYFFMALAFTIPIMLISMAGMFTEHPIFGHLAGGIVLLVLTLPVMFVSGREIFADAWNQTKHGHANMNSLIALGSLAAFLYSTYAILTLVVIKDAPASHFYFESAAMIITLILLGRFLETRAKGRARDAIGALLRLRPENATVIVDGEVSEVMASAVRRGMIILVKAGERIAADGKITESNPSIDESMLTGESMPVEKQVGDTVLGGSVNGNKAFKFEVTGTGENSFLAGIVRLVTEAQGRKAPVQRLADQIAGVFVPIVLLIAIATLVIWYFIDPSSPMLIKGPIAVLIIACPCALGLATPTAILAGTGRAARHGIYIRGADILERVVKTNFVVFDKTGTLTVGEFEVSVMKALDEDYETELLQLAASVESGSQHPLAGAIRKKADELNIKTKSPKNLTEFPGFGLKAEIDGRTVLVGNVATMEREHIDTATFNAAADEQMALGRTVVYVSSNGRALGFLAMADKVKDEAGEVIDKVRKTGREVLMLTGDNHKTARGVADQLGIEKFEAGIKPDQKAIIVETLRRADRRVMMVGDGINDAPALAAADIGVALGTGTDVAMESADIILVRDNLSALVEMLEISRLTFRTIKQNLFWAFFYNIIAIPLAAGLFYTLFGWGLSPIIAAGTMAFSSVFVVTNSLRLLKIKS
ncbi:MAG: copper-translocating P-type ATPase [candidate division Zixibacteria bacterium HGW-Zixibacteria-1]|nr:MAG: copper-translocating P-type ATPase [candidate division Zixibacteria bacterium HGW-Zixibacteria-1]